MATGFTIKLTRFDNLSKALNRKRNLLTRVEKAAAISATQVQGEAQRTLQRGSRSGRIYKRGKMSHQASAPGEPLKSDTGHLASHIFARVGTGFAEVGTAVRYGKFWEEAPSSKARPWLVPSFLKHKAAILRRMGKATKDAMRA